MAFSPRSTLPSAIIASEIGAAKSLPFYSAAKSGDDASAIRVALHLVTPELLTRLRLALDGQKPIVVGVASIESTGKNKIPLATAKVIARHLDLQVCGEIVQSSSPKRTSMGGLDRIFSTPQFDGPVQSGQSYLLVDDTITQGATFASLAQHIRRGGGEVCASVVLTGRQYSAAITPTQETLNALRAIHGDVEAQFRAVVGYGFDDLTQSEARYLANFTPVAQVRERILNACQPLSTPEDSSGPSSALAELAGRASANLVGGRQIRSPKPGQTRIAPQN